MALLEEHFDEALTKARLALERDPWLVEANLLMAQTHFARERKQSEQGDYEAAAHSTAEGLAAALQAESMARSSLEAYALEGEARFLELDLATEHGLPINQPAEAVRAALGKALLVDPEAGPVHVKMAITYRWWAEADEERGNDPQAHLEAALDHCRQAVRFCPDPYSATNLTTLTYQLLAEHLATHGRDPLPTLDLALASGKSAIEMRPQDHFPRNALGLVFLTKGTYLQKHGQDPHGDLRSALEMFADACRMSPGSWQSWGNQGICHRRLATQEAAEGANPLPSLDQARACYLEALKANPRESATLLNLGLLGRFRAGMELARGLDARTSLAEADQSLQRALEIKPGNASVLVGLGDLGALRGLQARLAGGNPLPDFQEAFRQYQKALASNRADPEAFERLANAWLEEGRYLAGEGRSAGAALAQAERAARQCLGLDPHNLPGLLDLGRIQLERSDLSAAAATAAKARVCSPISATPLLLEAEVILARNAKLPGGLRETQLAAAEADLKATEALAAWSPLRDVLRAQALLLRPGSGAGGRQRAVQAASMLRQAFLQDRLLPLKYRPWLDRAVKASA